MTEEEESAQTFQVNLKFVSLLTLTVQNATVTLWYRYVRTRENVDMFLAGSAVVMAELIKCLISLFIIFIEMGSVSKGLKCLNENIIQNPMDTVKVSVPSFVYVLQNNLQFIAISNLDAATYQVSYQLKILTTALFSVVMLNKKLSSYQWMSLVVLMTGVAAVQLHPSHDDADPADLAATAHQNIFIGMSAVLTSCLMSGFAGVYFEKILKGSVQSVWLRNAQLGFLGTILGCVTLAIKDHEALSEYGFFYGYDWAVWLAVIFHSIGGLIVAVVVKYADSILKGFATSSAIVLSCIASIYFFQFHLSMQFVAGTSMVILSVYIYGNFPFVPQQNLV